MLGGRISNQDEDEVEDELQAMEAEIAAVPLPEVPATDLPKKVGVETRGHEEEHQEERVGMLA
jgi:charged multivesicular body protein 6